MARKFKCEKCLEWNGGFHLCIGRPVLKEGEQGGTIIVPSEGFGEHLKKTGKNHQNRDAQKEASRQTQLERWARVWAQNRPRDEKILERYKLGYSLPEVGREFGMSKSQIQRIVERLEPGVVRPKGTNHHTVQKRDRA